ncbi:MAG TPA: aspartyl protease family protein [Steroidobacteraceae bacterium]|nr:aspartyl protease family protein [Steroidobacteraceae bacterium]
MRVRYAGLVFLGVIVSLSATAAERCVLKSFAELPVTMEGLRPVVVLKMNGVDTRFIIDSGAFYSMISPAAAAELKLPLRRAPFGFTVSGIGGAITPEVATVDTLTLANYPIHRVDFLVGGNEYGAAAAGLLGENLIRLADLEYDLANGVVRFIKPENCGNQPLAYWAPASQPIGMIDIERPSVITPWPIGVVSVNGTEVKAAFDTGAATSVLFLRGARRAGLTPSSPGVVAAGTGSGVGTRFVANWIAPIASFAIGGEEIKHTHIRILDSNSPYFDMLIGDDFFLSHRVYVANGQRKLYFTYQGGPVFEIGSRAQAEQSSSSSSVSAANASSPPAGQPSRPSGAAIAEAAQPASLGHFSDQPTQAAEFMRRGAAYAARRDFKDALPDLHRACELAPHDPDYFYELGRVQWQSGQPDLALQSFDKTIQLKADHVAGLLARAQLRFKDHARAKEDMDALDRVAPPQDSRRLQLGMMYQALDETGPAIHQYDLWIDAHESDVVLPIALNARCWAQASANQNLDQALKDCNAALRRLPKNAAFLDSRALVQLRRGELDRAIKDYDAALALRPKLATSLYGRGLAKLQKGLQAEGQADLAAASAIQPKIAERFARMGLTP